jgi:hypothetical protein
MNGWLGRLIWGMMLMNDPGERRDLQAQLDPHGDLHGFHTTKWLSGGTWVCSGLNGTLAESLIIF